MIIANRLKKTLTLNNKIMNNTLNKLTLLLFTLFMFIPTGYSQNNAAPGIQLLMSPSSVQQGSTGTLTATVGNYGNKTIVANSLKATISVGANTEILEIAPGSGWDLLSLTSGSANTIQLINTRDYDQFELGRILLTVRGNMVSEADVILGHIVYVTAKNQLLCEDCPSDSAPLNANQGNANSTNDFDVELPQNMNNAQTSLAVTCDQDLDSLVSMLPSKVTVTTTAKPGDDAYFNLTINDSSGFLSGTEIPAWCADQDLGLDNNETASFDVYSSYDELPEGRFEKPENFDKVNWLLNQTIIGEVSPNGLGEYTFGHFQYAIWLLIDDSVCQVCTFLTDPTSTWNNDGNDIAQAEEIRDLALAQGGGFTPDVGELLAIVLVPEGRQSVIIGKEFEEVPCDDWLNKTLATETNERLYIENCGSYFWELDGETYKKSGVYKHETINNEGDTHTTYLNLTIDKEKFVMYPVPFNQEVFASYNFCYDTNVKVEILDVKGTLIRSYIDSNYIKGSKGVIRIDLSNEANQLYIVKLTTAEEILFKKIVSSSTQRRN